MIMSKNKKQKSGGQNKASNKQKTERIVQSEDHKSTSTAAPESGISDNPNNRSISVIKPNEPGLGAKVVKILTIVGIIVGIIAGIISSSDTIERIYYKKFPSKEMRIKSINEKLVEIKQTFHPENIREDVWHPENKLIKEFQIRAIENVEKWKDVKAIDDISSYKNNSSEEIYNVINSQMDTYIAYLESVISVFYMLNKITEFGSVHNIDLTPNRARRQTLLNEVEKRNEETIEIRVNLQKETDSLSKKYKDIKNIPPSKMIKLAKPFMEVYTGTKELKTVNQIFSYYIETNSKYMLHVNRQSNYRLP